MTRTDPNSTDAADQPQKPRRIVFWGLILLAGLAILFIWVQAVPVLMFALRVGHPKVREIAAKGLESFGTAAVPRLIAALDDQNGFSAVRSSEALILRNIGEPALPYLIEAARDESFRGRGSAAILWHRIDPEMKTDDVEALVAVIRGPYYRECRLAAVRAIVEHGPRANAAVPALIDLICQGPDYRDCVTALIAIRTFGPEATPHLVRLIREGRAALSSLSHWRLPDGHSPAALLGAVAAGPLMAILADTEQDSYVRCVAARILASADPQSDSGVLALIDALLDRNPTLRTQVGLVLRVIRPHSKRAVRRLLALLTHADEYVRTIAARLLAVVGPRAADCVPILITALESEHPLVRATSAQALGSIGPAAESAIRALDHVLDTDPDGAVRDAAFEAASKISSPEERPPAARDDGWPPLPGEPSNVDLAPASLKLHLPEIRDFLKAAYAE